MEKEEEKCCRICLEPDKRNNLISPCLCSGTQKWVHRKCLDQWRITKEDKAFSKCTECLQLYTFLPNNNNNNQIYLRHLRFIGYCLFDILIGLICIFIITSLLSFIIYEIDKNNYLINKFNIKDNLIPLFYYGCSIFLCLTIIGIFYSFLLCTGARTLGNDNSRCCEDCCDSCCRGNIYTPMYIGGSNSESCCCCCHCHECAGAGCCDAGVCCDTCAGATCEQEGLIFLLILFVIFAIIGLMVSFIFGIMFVQNVTNKHIHILHKKSIVQEYVVKDLAETDDFYNNNNNNNNNSKNNFKDDDIELGSIKNNLLLKRRDDEEESISSTHHSSNSNMHRMLINREEDNDSTNTNYENYMTQKQQEELKKLRLL